MKLFIRKHREPTKDVRSKKAILRRRALQIGIIAVAVVTLTISVDTSGMDPALGVTAARHGGWSIDPIRAKDGTYLFCLEPGTLTPDGNTAPSYESATLPGYSVYSIDATGWSGAVTTAEVSGAPLRQMNYALEKYGQSTDRELREATQLAVWQLRGGEGIAVWIRHHISWLLDNGSHEVVSRATEIVEEAQREATIGLRSDITQLHLKLNDTQNEYERTGQLSYPAGTVSLRLSGATFANGKSDISVNPAVGGEVHWRMAFGPDEWSSEHLISAGGKWLQQTSVLPERLHVFPPTVKYQQVTGKESSRDHSVSEADHQHVELVIHRSLHPTLTTEVRNQLLASSEQLFADQVRVSAGENEPWPTRVNSSDKEEFMPITLRGVLYGPFPRELDRSEWAPANAPVATTETVVATDGPGVYEVSSQARAVPAGFYYWQWSVEHEFQDPKIQDSGLMGQMYSFFDAFGDPQELSKVPMSFDISTKLNSHLLEGEKIRFHDDVRLLLKAGEWIQDAEGKTVPVVARMRLYQQDLKPQRQPGVPAAANLVGEKLVSIDSGETGSSGEWLPGVGLRGWLTVQTCILQGDQADEIREMVVEVCDDYGIPDETAAIVSEPLSKTGDSVNLAVVLACGICVIAMGGLLVGMGLRSCRYRKRTAG